MKATEMIKKYSIKLHVDGDKFQIPATIGRKMTKTQLEMVKASKPEIMAELIRQKKSQKADMEARAEKWAEAEAKQEALDAPLLAAMYKEADSLRTQIPADHIEVAATQTGDLDGTPIMQYTANGEEVSWQDINVIGWASAVRPGALGSFASIQICSISKARLEQIKAGRVTAENKKINEEKTESDRVANIFAIAKSTNQKQKIRHYMAECNDPYEECSTDIVTVYAMPDGTTKAERQHTW